MQRLFDSWTWFRAQVEDFTIIAAELNLSDKRGGYNIPILYIANEEKVFTNRYGTDGIFTKYSDRINGLYNKKNEPLFSTVEMITKDGILIKIEGKPLIHHQLDSFEKVEDVRIVVGFQAKEVIETVLEKRKDVIFAYNHDYFHTKTGASFYLGARHGKKYAIAWDGDLLVHPKDVEKCLNFHGEFVGCSDVVSDEPVFVKLNCDNEVVSFSRENGDFEWVGPACLERHKIKFVSNNVFNQFENFLPIPMLKTDARDIDTYDDYLRAKIFVKSWSHE